MLPFFIASVKTKTKIEEEAKAALTDKSQIILNFNKSIFKDTIDSW